MKIFKKQIVFLLVVSLIIGSLNIMPVNAEELPEEVVTGFLVADSCNWDDEAQKNVISSDAEYRKETWSDPLGNSMHFIYRDESGNSTNIPGSEINFTDAEGNPVESIHYQVSGGGEDNGEDMLDVTYDTIGEFRAYYNEEYVTIYVEYSSIGFYYGKTFESGCMNEYIFSNLENGSFYMIFNPPASENSSVSVNSIVVRDYDAGEEYTDEQDVAKYVTFEQVLEEVYKVNIEADKSFELSVEGNVSDGENSWSHTQSIWIGYEEILEGLTITSELDWIDDVPSVGLATFYKEIDASLPTLTAAFKYITYEGDVENSVYLSAEELQVVDSEGNEAEGVKIKTRTDTTDQNIVDLEFASVGDYKVLYEYATGEFDEITIHVGYPVVGFYKGDTKESGYLQNFVISDLNKASFYMIVNEAPEGEEFALAENFLTVYDYQTETTITDGEAVSEYLTCESVEGKINTYKITLLSDKGFDVIAHVNVTNADDSWKESCSVGTWYEEPKSGLKLADWIAWDDNDNPYIHEESGYYGNYSITVKDKITTGFGIFDEEGNPLDMSNGQLTIEGNSIETPIDFTRDEIEEEQVSIQRVSEDKCIYDVSFSKTGKYTITYKEEEKEDLTMTLEVRLPLVGVYTDKDNISEDTLQEYELRCGETYYVITTPVEGEYRCENLSGKVVNYKEDSIKLIKLEEKDGHEIFELKFAENLDATFEYIITYDSVWEEGERGENSNYYTVKANTEGRVAYTDGQKHTGFTGCYIEKYEFESGNINWQSGGPLYYVHTDSIQGVIDKLSSVANGEMVLYKEIVDEYGNHTANRLETTEGKQVVNTGYIYIVPSHFGNVDLEDQYVSSSGNMKGIVFAPGQDYYMSDHDLDNGVYVEDRIYEMARIKADLPELMQVPEIVDNISYISKYKGDFYFTELADDQAYRLGDRIEFEDTEATAEFLEEMNRLIENDPWKYYAIMEPFVYPNLHVNVYCDMKFAGRFEKLSVGFKEGKNFKASVVDSFMGTEYTYTMADLEGEDTKQVTATMTYGDARREQDGLNTSVTEDFPVWLYNIDSETTTSGNFAGTVTATETPEPNSLTELSQEQRDAIEASGKLTVNIHTDSKQESELPAAMTNDFKDKIKEAYGNEYKGFEYMDIHVSANVEEVEGETPITNTKAEMEISMDIPANLRKDGRKFKIIRHHKDKNGNEKVDILEPVVSPDGKKMTFRTNKFSTYAISYDSVDEEKLNFDMSRVKWNYASAFTYDGNPKSVSLTGLPTGLTVTYRNNVATQPGKYTAIATFSYDTTKYNAPNVQGISSLTWEIAKSSNDGGSSGSGNAAGGDSSSGGNNIPGGGNGTGNDNPAGEEKPSNVGKEYTVSNAKYVITSDTDGKNTVTFSGVVKSQKKVKIKSTVTIDGVKYDVTAIGNNAMSGDKKMTSITIPSGITSIGNNAFKNCTKLKSVTIPKNVTTIGNNAFYGCVKLTKVKFAGSKVTKISKGAFRKCSVLKSVIIPKSVKEIGKDAFRDCKKLSSVNIKGKVLKSIGKNAFKNVSSKICIKVPKSKKTEYTKMLKNSGYKKKIK